MSQGILRDTVQEILDITNPEVPWHRSMLDKSDVLLETLEQLNLSDRVFVSDTLKLRILDFMNECRVDPAIDDAKGPVNLKKFRVTVARAMDWIYKCQGVIMGTDEEENGS